MPVASKTGLVAALLTSFALVAASCAGSTSNECGRVIADQIADDALVHVIASAQVQYATDPPTSGPHAPGPVAGIYDRTLTGPEQVGVLERGDIMVQFGATVAVADLEPLVEGDVVLAPNPSLANTVVLTAWGQKMTCRSATDLEPMVDFITSNKSATPRTQAG